MRICAFLFGVVFIALTITGLMAKDGYLFGVLKVNTELICIYLATGLIACAVAFWKGNGVLLYFQIVGIVYAVLAILGFVYKDQDILDVVANSLPNAWLHTIAATNALILGYGSDNRAENNLRK